LAAVDSSTPGFACLGPGVPTTGSWHRRIVDRSLRTADHGRASPHLIWSNGTANLLTNGPLSSGLATACRRVDADGPIATFVESVGESQGGASNPRIFVDSRGIDDSAPRSPSIIAACGPAEARESPTRRVVSLSLARAVASPWRLRWLLVAVFGHIESRQDARQERELVVGVFEEARGHLERHLDFDLSGVQSCLG